jgi:hypothetical protein
MVTTKSLSVAEMSRWPIRLCADPENKPNRRIGDPGSGTDIRRSGDRLSTLGASGHPA